MPIDFEVMKVLAFHRELVASRRLARQQGLDETTALTQVLANIAAESGLVDLLQQRQQRLATLAEIKLEKKRIAEKKRTMKLSRNAVSDASWCGWFDGSARPNPGNCYIGVVLKSASGQVWEISRAIGYGDSSYAEYHALLALLKMALKQGVGSLTIFGDSQVVIEDLQSKRKNHVSECAELRLQAIELMTQVPALQLKWIPRAKNRRADELARRA
jgi:ribonuclease HI